MRTDLTPAQAMRLAAWLSPSFPTGAFSYSHGLERAVEVGAVHDEASLRRWLAALLRFGSGRSEAVLFACAYRAARSAEAYAEVAALGRALRPSAELALESEGQGRAFLEAVTQAWCLPELEALCRWHREEAGPPVLAVAVGAVCRLHALPLGGALVLHLHAFAANLVSAGVRLVPLGQSAGQRVVAALEPTALAVAEACREADLDDVGSASPTAEILSMQHETQYTRLFRS